ncbi:MAG: efflux RND transporter periplasmic adaptor subunit [Planctomycetes bacterium]|nr:efflux RND transporter periplasmic adaptor subunit [Planctomycetota bacterium]
MLGRWRERWPDLWANAWMTLGTLGAAWVIASLLGGPAPADPAARQAAPAEEAVTVLGPGRLALRPDTPLARRLTVTPAAVEEVSRPLLTVTGTVLARVYAGEGDSTERWAFSSPDLADAYTDWVQAQVDVEFADEQLSRVRRLTEVQVTRSAELKRRLRQLVDAGSEAAMELISAEADLLQAELQAQRDQFEAENALKVARRARAAAERRLRLGGLEPAALGEAADGTVIVAANVPEAHVPEVHAGQACVARIYGLPGASFDGVVESLGAALTAERMLRALLRLDDPGERLRPGMFAEVGLGTEPREVVTVPAQALLRVGDADCVLVREDDGLRVAEVVLGRRLGGVVEVVAGLAGGEPVVAADAILLKPFVVEARAR